MKAWILLTSHTPHRSTVPHTSHSPSPCPYTSSSCPPHPLLSPSLSQSLDSKIHTSPRLSGSWRSDIDARGLGKEFRIGDGHADGAAETGGGYGSGEGGGVVGIWITGEGGGGGGHFGNGYLEEVKGG